jgi:coenzyme PQQ precursor peptide PqqA
MATAGVAAVCGALSLGSVKFPVPRALRCVIRNHIIWGCKYRNHTGGNPMAWTTPILVEICVGLEINGYLPAEF